MQESGTRKETDFYGGRDPLDMPLYTYADAARYLDMPYSTVRYWSKGGSYSSRGKRGYFEPLIKAAGDGKLSLSFLNLVELDVLNSLRKVHEVSSDTVRVGLENAREELNTPRPLLSDHLHTFGRRLFTDQSGSLIELTNLAQAVLDGVLWQVLNRGAKERSEYPRQILPGRRRCAR